MFSRWSRQLGFMRNLLGTHYDPRLSWRKNAAGAHLNYSFNILPNISDIRKLVKAARTFSARYNKMISEMRKPVSRRFRTTVAMPITKTVQVIAGAQEMWKQWEFIEQPLFCATSHFTYDIPKLSGWTKWLSLLDYLGINLNPKILWEATPFSFVVDWFTRVGDYLENFKETNVSIPIRYTDISYSLKYEVKYTYTQAKAGFERGEQVLRNAYQSRYERWRGTLATPSITAGSYGIRQGALTVSLGIVLFGRK